MPFPALIPLLTTLAPAVAGLFGNRQQQQQTTNQNTNTNSSQSGSTYGSSTSSGGSTPTLDPETMGYRNNLINAFTQMMGTDTDLSGYKSQGLKEISDSTNRSVTGLKNFLSSRGISNTEGAGIGATNILNAGTDQANKFKSSLPQLALDNMLKKLQAAGGFFSSIPTGTQTYGNSVTSGNSSQTGQSNQTGSSQTLGNPADPWGGFFTGLAAGGAQAGNQWNAQSNPQNDLAAAYAASIASAGPGYGTDPYFRRP